MRVITLSLIFIFLFSCSSKTILPKAPMVKESERILEKAEKFLLSQNTETKELIETGLSLSIATNIPDLKIRALLLKVNYNIREGKIDEAIKNLNAAKQISINESSQFIPYVKYYETLVAYVTNDSDALKNLLIDNTNYPDHVQMGINILKSLFYINSNDLVSAEKHINETLKISNSKNLLVEKSFALKLLSWINFKNKNFNEALDIINESLDIDRSLNLLDYLYWDLEFIAKIYLNKYDKEKALYYYSTAYELALINKNQNKADYFKSVIQNLLK